MFSAVSGGQQALHFTAVTQAEYPTKLGYYGEIGYSGEIGYYGEEGKINDDIESENITKISLCPLIFIEHRTPISLF
jgi:hypothetical protein